MINGNKSFTLVELLTVIIIIGILTGATLHSLVKAKTAVQITECHNYSRQLRIYWLASNEGENYYSQAFEDFKKNRVDISRRLGDERSITSSHIKESEYREGYGSLSQDVMGPAFLASYGWYYDKKGSITANIKR